MISEGYRSLLQHGSCCEGLGGCFLAGGGWCAGFFFRSLSPVCVYVRAFARVCAPRPHRAPPHFTDMPGTVCRPTQCPMERETIYSTMQCNSLNGETEFVFFVFLVFCARSSWAKKKKKEKAFPQDSLPLVNSYGVGGRKKEKKK